MLVRASFSSKPPQNVVNAPFQGSSNFNHLKQAAENLMRQQHSDKTDFELAAQRIRTLEYEKSELVETNTKLLETKVKLETIAQSAKKNYDALRFDCIAADTVCKSVQDHVTDAQKKSSTINNEIALLKDRMHQLQRLCESSEAIMSKEVVRSRDLKEQVMTIKNERDSAVRQNEDLRAQLHALNENISTRSSDNERLKKIVEAQTIEVRIAKEQSESTKQEATAIQDKLQNQIHDKDQTIEHMSQEFQTKLNMIEEGERKLRLDLEQSQKLLNESVDKCKVWESLVNDSAEKIKKMEQEGAAMESQQMQTVESIRSSQLKLEQEYEVLQKEVVGLREDLAQAHTSKSEVAEALQKAVSDLAAAQGSHEDMRKDEQKHALETEEKTKQLAAAYEDRENELKAEIDNANNRIAEMQKEKESALRAQQAGFIAMKESLVAGSQKIENDFVAQLSRALEKERALLREKADLVDDIATLAEKLNEAKRELEEVQQQHKEHQEANPKTSKADKKQIENLNQLLEKKNKEILDLKQQLTKQPPSKPSSAKFLIQAKDVPTSSDDSDIIESVDSAPDSSISKSGSRTTTSTSSISKKDAAPTEPKKKRQLRNTGAEYASPTKRVHFLSDQPKKATTFSKRKASAKSTPSVFDEYTFRG